MFDRAELVIFQNYGEGSARIKALSNSLIEQEEIDYPSINVAVSKVYYLETDFKKANFSRTLQPYLVGGEPEELRVIWLNFNGQSFKVTAAEVGKGTALDGTETWFTEDGTEDGKPVTSKFLEWLDNNL